MKPGAEPSRLRWSDCRTMHCDGGFFFDIIERHDGSTRRCEPKAGKAAVSCGTLHVWQADEEDWRLWLDPSEPQDEGYAWTLGQ